MQRAFLKYFFSRFTVHVLYSIIPHFLKNHAAIIALHSFGKKRKSAEADFVIRRVLPGIIRGSSQAATSSRRPYRRLAKRL